MTLKVFVDSNILIYAHDIEADQKYEVANNILRRLWNEKSGVLSMQVLQEFYNITTKKLKMPLAKPTARALVTTYSVWCIETTPAEIASAFNIEDTAKISFWDALIVASALKSGAAEILSEDMNPGQIIAGIRIVNPFLK